MHCVSSAGEPAGEYRLPWTGQLLDGAASAGNCHQNGFGRSGDFWSGAVTPVQVGRGQAYATGEVPPGELGAAQAVVQDAMQSFGWDLVWHSERATDVLMMDGDIE